MFFERLVNEYRKGKPSWLALRVGDCGRQAQGRQRNQARAVQRILAVPKRITIIVTHRNGVFLFVMVAIEKSFFVRVTRYRTDICVQRNDQKNPDELERKQA
jgi:hypothetical protein